MFGFGWVRTHLGVILSDAFGSFKFLDGFLEKWTNWSKIWARSRVLRRGEGTPHRSEGPRHVVACSRRGVAEKRIFSILGVAAA